MLANYEEFECLVIDMSPGDMYVTCQGRPRSNERVVAYIDHLGRVEGYVQTIDTRGFSMSMTYTGLVHVMEGRSPDFRRMWARFGLPGMRQEVAELMGW